jgi:antitoxin FitA
MAQLIVRNIDDRLVGALKRRAARHGRSAEAEHREILMESLRSELADASFKEVLASMPAVGEDEDFTVERGPARDVRL